MNFWVFLLLFLLQHIEEFLLNTSWGSGSRTLSAISLLFLCLCFLFFLDALSYFLNHGDARARGLFLKTPRVSTPAIKLCSQDALRWLTVSALCSSSHLPQLLLTVQEASWPWKGPNYNFFTTQIILFCSSRDTVSKGNEFTQCLHTHTENDPFGGEKGFLRAILWLCLISSCAASGYCVLARQSMW